MADARAQAAATVEADKKSSERAKAAEKKLEEAKNVLSAANQDAAALQIKIKNTTAELSVARTQLQQTSCALQEMGGANRVLEGELQALKSQVSAGRASLDDKLQSAESARMEYQAQVEQFRDAARAAQEETKEARSASSA